MNPRGFRLLATVMALAVALTPVLSGRPNTVKKSSGGKVVVTNQPDRPENTTLPGNDLARVPKVIAPKTFNTKSIDPKMARVNGERSPIIISETNSKVIKAYDTKDITIIQSEVLTNPADELMVTTKANEDFQQMIAKYQKARQDPVDGGKANIENAGDVVSLDKINRYSDAAGSVDAEGIPVEGADETETADTVKPVLRDGP